MCWESLAASFLRRTAASSKRGHSESCSDSLVASFPVQDGTIEYQIKLTGELSTNPLSPDEDPSSPTYGTLVAKDVNAQAHQHLVRTVSTCPA